jgi:hypothetical protein
LQDQKGAFAEEPRAVVEKQGDSPPSMPCLSHREPFKSIATTRIHPPLRSVIRFAVFAVGTSFGKSMLIPFALATSGLEA